MMVFSVKENILFIFVKYYESIGEAHIRYSVVPGSPAGAQGIHSPVVAPQSDFSYGNRWATGHH
jgi:hypothetical protein